MSCLCEFGKIVPDAPTDRLSRSSELPIKGALTKLAALCQRLFDGKGLAVTSIATHEIMGASGRNGPFDYLPAYPHNDLIGGRAGAMDYRKELEALMGETTALLSRTAPPREAPTPPTPRPYVPIDHLVSILNEPSRPAPRPYNFAPPNLSKIAIVSEISERTHQERLRREREDYCSKIISQMRNAVEDRRPLKE